MRLDQALVAKGFFPTRTRAQAAIMAGLVCVNGRRVDKAGAPVRETDALEVKGKPHPWASRGGMKLVRALTAFGVDVAGKVALDAGSSTGGFTDVLLSRGIGRVHAVDVGRGLLRWRLRQDPRVILHERTNVRYLTEAILGERVDLVTLDLSFIGLEKVFPAVGRVLGPAWLAVLALVKPQFQVGKGKVGKGGVVRDPQLHLEALVSVLEAGTAEGWRPAGCVPSPIKGADGNVEFWLAFTRRGTEGHVDLAGAVREAAEIQPPPEGPS